MPSARGDVIRATAELVSRLGEVASGLHYEGADCVCSAGTIHAGTAVNVVPTSARVTGTLRTFTETQHSDALARLQDLCDRVGDDQGVHVELELPEHTRAVVNDPGATALVEAEAAVVVGPDQVFRMPPVAPSDDVSEFLRHLPGCYFFVGGGAGGRLERHAPQPHVPRRGRVAARRCQRPGAQRAGIGRAVTRGGHNGPMTASDLFDIAGKTALVTGGSRGIGRMIAEGFVDAGVNVYISSRKADVCAEVAAELSKNGDVRRHPGRSVHRGRMPPPGRRDGGTGGLARHPGEQRRRHLGHAAGGLRRGRLRARARPQRQGGLPPDQVPGPAAREGGDGRGTGPRHQHRVDRRDPGAGARDVLLLGVQGRRAPADPAPGQAPGPGHHRQRHRAGALRVEDDGRHARGLRRPDRRPRARSSASGGPTTWPAPPSTCRHGPVPT